jgi:hypothetical protein
LHLPRQVRIIRRRRLAPGQRRKQPLTQCLRGIPLPVAGDLGPAGFDESPRKYHRIRMAMGPDGPSPGGDGVTNTGNLTGAECRHYS